MMTISSFVLTAFILFTSALAADAPTVAYSGYRVTLPKTTAHSGFLVAFSEVVKASTGSHWPDLEHRVGSGIFSVAFSAKGLKCTQAEYDPAKMTEKNFHLEQNTLTLSQKGKGLTYTFELNWDFEVLGMHLLFGTAQLTLTTSQLNIILSFVDQEVSAKVEPTWGLAIQNVKGGSFFAAAVEKWIAILVNPALFQAVMAALNPAMGAKATGLIAPWVHLSNPLHENNTLDMVLQNFIVEMKEAPENFVSVGVATSVRVDKRPYNKMMWKTVNTSVSLQQEGIEQMCVSNDILVAMQEVIGKARDMLRVVEPNELSLKGTVNDLTPIMPQLEAQYDTSSISMKIGCRPYGDYDMVMLKDEGGLQPGQVKVQLPLTCSFFSEADSKEVLGLEFFVRATLTQDVKDNGKEMLFTGTLSDVKLYSYLALTHAAPIEGYDTLLNLVYKLSKLYDGFKMVEAGLRIPKMNPAASILAVEHKSYDETCVTLK